MSEVSLSVDAHTILPHRPPMLLIDRLVSIDEEQAIVSANLPSDCVFAGGDGRLDCVIYAELVAQAYAAFKGYQLQEAGEAIKEGFLVGIRKMRVSGHACAGDALRITVTTVGLLQGFAVVDGVVVRGDEHIAEVRLKLYVPEEGGPQI